MRKKIICLFIVVSIFMAAGRLMAWSDDVSGVLMPEPRGGGEISGEEAEGAIYDSEKEETGDPQDLIEWE